MTTKELQIKEAERLTLQAELDAQKTQLERNRLGQFATPTELARDVLLFASKHLGAKEQIRFLDPAIGTGSFYSAAANVFGKRIAAAVGYEVDPHYGEPAVRLWKGQGLDIKLADFTLAKPDRRFNLVICNPPYVRHHHLDNQAKERLHGQTFDSSGMKLSGLAGLYCHFVGLTHPWMADDGLAGWLIPSEFMDVNYGREVKRYLLEQVTLIQVHRFDPNDVQFSDALVSSAVVWFKKSPPQTGHEVLFSFGGTLNAPRVTRKVSTSALVREAKWTRFPLSEVRDKGGIPTISDFFTIKRGLATGDNGYFILPERVLEERKLPREFFKPILPSPRYLTEDRVTADHAGIPISCPRLFLLDSRLPESEISARFPALAEYLLEGRAQGLHERYLCRHRSVWYAQEVRPPAPIVCTYLGRGDAKRGRPFRFILNESEASAANVYLMMYPTPLLLRALKRDASLVRKMWELLNSLAPEQLLDEGRVYGGGLHKLEPKELGNVPVPQFAELLAEDERPMKQVELFSDARAA